MSGSWTGGTLLPFVVASAGGGGTETVGSEGGGLGGSGLAEAGHMR